MNCQTSSLEQKTGQTGVQWFQGFDDTTVADLEERATIFWHCLATCDFAYFDFFFLPVECFLYYFWPVDSNNNLFQ